ncbi:hypothetical protein GF360_01400 [candidate division WWE3 bacterium]|nr:hypothetical protein [candidate division WWE3 bacterium]
MRKYLSLFKSHLSVSLDYRADLIGTFILELLSVGSAIILWFAIYRTNEDVGGYSLEEVVLYYVLVPFVGFLTSVDVSRKLAQSVRNGSLSNQLLKPYKIWLDALMEALSKKVVYLSISLPLYVLFLFLGINARVLSPYILSIQSLLLGFSFIVLAFLLHFFLDLFVSWLAFWFSDIWSFKHFKRIVFAMLGGVSFPFDLLPANVRAFFELLPFKYFYFTPISYLLGKGTNVLKDILLLLFWFLVFVLLTNLIWRRGIKKYEAYGN